MNPRLIFPAGALDPKMFPLTDNEPFSIGRAESNQLVISAIGVSRRHCIISGENGAFQVKDLESYNGTFVNNQPVTETALKHGDSIRVGKTEILFLSEDEDFIPPHYNFQFDNGALVTQSEIVFGIGQSLEKTPTDLNALAEFGQAVVNLKDSSKLQKRFLEIILEIIPAERSAILLFENDADEPFSVCVVNADKTGKMTVSRTVSQRVLSERIALLSNDLFDENLNKAESLIATSVASLLCVPLQIGEKRGLIYLDSRIADTLFTENHLRQLTAISFLISAALAQQISIEELQNENARLQTEYEIETNLIGVSDEINKVFQLIKKVSPTDSNVLITGESGTGKEMAAQSIYRNSPRRDKPFIAINCATLNDNLLESDLFGHEKGAFTGAIAQKKGKFEIADGGTIFLDEIGELASHLQAKLLRFLQEREFERVGGNKIIKTDVRVIAATNRNLAEEVKNGTFREDLFFRINVINIKMPPLAERKSDIPFLAQHFVKKYSERLHRRVTGLSEKARKILMSYNWTGNVRELENIIERAIVLGTTDTIEPEDLPDEINTAGTQDAPDKPDLHQQLKAAKQKIILDAIEESGGNYSEAARRLGIHPNNLHRIVRNLKIREQTKGREEK